MNIFKKLFVKSNKKENRENRNQYRYYREHLPDFPEIPESEWTGISGVDNRLLDRAYQRWYMETMGGKEHEEMRRSNTLMIIEKDNKIRELEEKIKKLEEKK